MQKLASSFGAKATDVVLKRVEELDDALESKENEYKGLQQHLSNYTSR